MQYRNTDQTDRRLAVDRSRSASGIAHLVIAAFLALMVSFSMPAARADAVDNIVRQEMAKSGAPGVAVLIMRQGKVVKRRGYGFANLEHRIPVTPETVFESGSMGKQFTAALVMMLVQDGRLSLQTPITQFFPEGKGKWGGVTVRHLLTHTSGIGDMPYDEMDMAKHYSEQDLVDLMALQPRKEIPGKVWSYNNGGYVLLGILIHRLTGRFYGDLLRERIFEPLNMKTAQVISEHDIVMHRSSGYQMEDYQIKNQDWVSPSLNTTADGSLYLGVDDMLRWDAAMYDNQILQPKLLSQMWEPAQLLDGKPAVVNPGAKFPVCYGMGWTVCKKPGLTCIAHAGGWQGFASYYGRIPEKRLSVVVFANIDTADAATIAKLILEMLEPDLRDGDLQADSRVP